MKQQQFLEIVDRDEAEQRWRAAIDTAPLPAENVPLSQALGRVLAVFENNRGVDAETLELKLDEAVLRETSQLQRFLWIVKTVSVVAPLLGLLGTVTGIIFIPAHLAEEVVISSENIRLKDEFGKQRLSEGVYTPGEVDRPFSEAMTEDFDQWKVDRAKG